MLRDPRVQRWLKFLIALGVSAVFSVLFLKSVDLGEVAASLRDADYVYVVPAMALFGASLAIRALRWHFLLQPGHSPPWRELLPSLLVGYAGNNVLPLRAGELLRAQHLAAGYGVARMRSFGTFLMERLFDWFLLATFVLWGLLLVDVPDAYLGIGVLIAAGTAAGFAVCTLLALRPEIASRLANLTLLPARARAPLTSLSASFLEGFSALRSPSRFGLVAITTVLAWGLELAMYWLIAVAFGLHASFITIAFAGAAANVAMSLPAAQGGVGPFQWSAMQALIRFGVATDAAGAYALALHIFLVVPVSLVGLLVLWRSTLPGARRAPMPVAALESQE